MAMVCLGCMQPKESSPICEHCGYDDRAENLIHQLPVGTTLQNQYLIGRVLGQGGFGITYLGWDQFAAGPVAIKEYFPSGVVQRHPQHKTHVLLTSGEAPERFQKYSSRFLKEARTLAQLTDIPEIVQIRSFFSENDTAYIVMEYVQGITLKEHLKKLGRPMTETEALAIMEPVLLALQKVHDQGLIHRDISPDNIMLPDGGGIKLIDFGTVRYVDDSGKSKSTEAILKPGFAPMEQYNTHGKLGTWTDVYAICATFHYLLTGKVPADVHERLEDGENLSILRSQSNISRKLIDALEKGMKVRSSGRIQTIGELHKLLYGGKKAVKPKAEKPKVTEEKTSTHQKKNIRNIRKAAILVICASIILAALTPKVILPFVKYTNAVSKMEAGRYEEAIIAFEALNGFLDAEQHILSCREGIKDAAYQNAIVLMEQQNYDEALSVLKNIRNYKNCEELIAVCLECSIEEKYKYAVELMQAQKYEDAKKLFETLTDYKDSQALIEECTQHLLDTKMEKAVILVNAGKYSAAIPLFMELQNAGRNVSAELQKCDIQLLESSKTLYVTNGKPQGAETKIWGSARDNAKLHSLSRVTLDNGCVRFTLDCTVPKCNRMSVFNPPSGTHFMYLGYNIKEGRQTFVFDITQTDLKAAGDMTILFEDQPRSIIYVSNPY